MRIKRRASERKSVFIKDTHFRSLPQNRSSKSLEHFQANLNPQMTVPKGSSKQQSKRHWRIKNAANSYLSDVG
jgi:hypothetical protein